MSAGAFIAAMRQARDYRGYPLSFLRWQMPVAPAETRHKRLPSWEMTAFGVICGMMVIGFLAMSSIGR